MKVMNLIILFSKIGVGVYILLFIILVVCVVLRMRHDKQCTRYKYVFKNPCGDVLPVSFTIWSGDEGIYNAHNLAKNYSDTYPYYNIAIVDTRMSLQEVQYSEDVVWKSRSSMFYRNGKE